MIRFESAAAPVGLLEPRSAGIIEREPMLYRADYTFARAHGGPITHEFLRALAYVRPPFSDMDFVIDSRVHMLMRGWYPCIPGWHHDDVPRDTPRGQPNYDAPSYHAQHLMAVVDASDSPTGALPECLVGRVEVPWPLDESAVIYAAWDAHIATTRYPAEMYRPGKSGEMLRFDAHTFHRGTSAVRRGWRFFIRATWDTEMRPENKKRLNANVYMPALTAGW